MKLNGGIGTMEKIVSSINGVGKTEQPHAKECNWTKILHHTPKSIQNGLKTWMQAFKPKNSRRKRRDKLLDITLGNDFLDLIPKAKAKQKSTSETTSN